ncbi:UDP-glycosyltransferase 85A4 [Acorus calamus]|uniref:UDP-glycosyltransferase 85A4 n=1 Tax=Acorus calamus TaxID=4465 RepID=A0AAV9CXV1_ACOCL|nr:UDP-glycosyltransferase 85A4 [Acorus calamus]
MEVPHVIVFPLPIQGNTTAMLGLSELFTTAGLRVTFITTEHNLRKLPTSSAGYMSFRAVPDGLPDGHDRSGRHIGALVESLRVHATPVLREMLMGSCGGDDEGSSPPPVTCVVADGIMSFLIDLAEELVIPVFCFRAISACCLWSFLCLPRLIEDGVLPFHDETDMDERIQSVPGMEGFLRRRDLPSFCRTKELAHPTFQLHLIETQAAIRCSGLILNTLDPLESTVISHIRSQIPTSTQSVRSTPPPSSPNQRAWAACATWTARAWSGSTLSHPNPSSTSASQA